MARIRTVKPDFFTDEKLTACSPTARLLFIGLLCFVDDYGVMQYSPKRTKMLIFPADNLDVEPFIAELVAQNRVVLYQSEGRSYLWVRNFTRHQRINRPSKWRAGPLPEDQGALSEHSSQGTGNGNGNGVVPTTNTHNSLTEDSLRTQCVERGTSEEPRERSEGLNSTEVSRALCSENGWSGQEMIWTLKDAIEFQVKQMPEASLEQVGEWLVKAYNAHRTSQGKYAVGVRKFFAEGRYKTSPQSGDGDYFKERIFTDNPATRARAQMEAD